MHKSTETFNAEKALTQREQHFRAMCDVVPTALWMSDVDGNCVYVNRHWIEFTGKNLNQALGAGWLDGLHPEDHEPIQATVMTAFAARQEFNVEYRLGRADGEYRWVFDTGVPRYTLEDRFAGHIASFIDITERKRAEDQARQSESRYQTLVHASPLGIFHTDAEGKCTYVNERWCEITGLTAAEALGDEWVRALHPEDRERIAAECHAAYKGYRLFESSYRFLCPDGRIAWVYGQATKEQDTETGEVIGYVGTITDVTEQKGIEQRLLQQRTELCHAQRLIAVGELAGIMAHELSKPLGAIANYIEGAINRDQVEPGAHSGFGDVLKHILKLTERTTAIIESLRALMRKQGSKRQPVDINTLIRKTVSLTETEVARRKVKITLDLGNDIRMPWGDSVQLQQLLLNVILNGLEAMAAVEGTDRRLTIQTRTRLSK